LGGHLHIVYRTECLLANVGGDWLAGDGCHQPMLVLPRVMAGHRLLVVRGRRSWYGCRWRGRGPRFAAVGPSGAASWRSGHVGAARVGLARSGGFVGGRGSAGDAGVASQPRFVRMWPVTARVRPFTQPPNPPMHHDLRNQGNFGTFGCAHSRCHHVCWCQPTAGG
jgi:hypothetical protein